MVTLWIESTKVFGTSALLNADVALPSVWQRHAAPRCMSKAQQQVCSYIVMACAANTLHFPLLAASAGHAARCTLLAIACYVHGDRQKESVAHIQMHQQQGWHAGHCERPGLYAHSARQLSGCWSCWGPCLQLLAVGLCELGLPSPQHQQPSRWPHAPFSIPRAP